ncbi:hypothetical protein [Nocardia sp. NPDC051463]|uniref:hypothetical protein n=1 Tax=Nocardia sp. NPDC051463 TaxID=3154845 RepID=UPI00344CFE55
MRMRVGGGAQGREGARVGDAAEETRDGEVGESEGRGSAEGWLQNLRKRGRAAVEQLVAAADHGGSLDPDVATM